MGDGGCWVELLWEDARRWRRKEKGVMWLKKGRASWVAGSEEVEPAGSCCRALI